MSYFLKIAGHTVEIGDPKSLPLGTTFEATDITDPSKAKGSRSNKITFPQTVANAIRLGTNDMSAPLTDRAAMPFEISDGAGIIWKGRAVPSTTRTSTNEWELIGDNAVWFDRVKDRSLSDLDLGKSEPHEVSEVIASWDLTTAKPLLFPLADYGNLGDKLATYDVDLKYVLPAVNFKWIMDTLFASLGFEVIYKGGIGMHLRRMFFLFNEKLDALKAPDEVLEEQTTVWNRPTPTTFSTPNTLVQLPFSNIVSDPASQAGTAGSFIPQYDGRYNITIAYNITGTASYGFSFYMDIKNLTTNQIWVGQPQQHVTYPNSLTEDVVCVFENIPFNAGEEYAIVIQVFSIVGYTINTGTVTWEPVSIPWQQGLSCTVASACPKMKQSEFISGVLASFNAVPITDLDQGRVTIMPQRDWLKPPEQAIDWSDKLDVAEEEPAKVRETVPKYQEFRCEEEGDDLLAQQFVSANGRGLGDHDVVATDKNAEGIFEVSVPWAATHVGQALGGIIMPRLINADEDDPDLVTYGWKPRAVYFSGLVDAAWKLASVNMSKVPDVYFVKPSSTYGDLSLSFATNGGTYGSDTGLVHRYHQERVDRIEFCRYLEVMLHLNDQDVRMLDMSVPVKLRIAGTPKAFYVLKVDEYLWGQGVSTPVRLVEAVGHLPSKWRKDTIVRPTVARKPRRR